MSSLTTTSSLPSESRVGLPLAFVWQEYLQILRSRRMKLLLFFVVYMVFGLPFILKKPPAEVLKYVNVWFGEGSTALKLLLFIWTDIAMNKMAVFCGLILAGGVFVDERARGTIQVFLSKPISRPMYFLVKVFAANMAFFTLYGIAVLAASLYFPFAAKGFDLWSFWALSSTHCWAASFGVTFSALMAVTFHKKVSAMLVSVLVLFMLVGVTFIGFYNPKLIIIGYLNPFYHGISLIAKLGSPLVIHIVLSTLVLWLFHAGVLALGCWRVSKLEDL